MTSFQQVRNRDAWATIRGYVYQVDVTIDRWLDLQSGQVLELERGEDIDVVSEAIHSQDLDTRLRLLEQVKYRASSITLRSPEAIAALVNFYEHRTMATRELLRFRFVSNAQSGHEQHSPLPNRLPGIEAWEFVRKAQEGEARQAELLTGLRTLLTSFQKDQKPQDIHDQAWEGFRTFVRTATDGDLLAYIRSFEWGMGTNDAKSLRQQLQQRLLAAKYARDLERANEVYVQLFFTVFERLTHSGSKRLTVEDREHLLTQPSFDTRAMALLETVRDLLETHEERFHVIEERVQTTERVQEVQIGQIAALQDQVGHLVHTQRIEATITYGKSFVASLDVPPLVQHLSRRQQTIDDLKRRVQTHTWTALLGQSSCGKTQLVALLVENLEKPCLWIRLMPEYSCEENRRRLDAACVERLGTSAERNLSQWYKHVMESLGRGGVLVLDGLPRLLGQEPLSEALRSLLSACKSTGCSIISTSPYSLPERLKASCRAGDLFTMVCPLCTYLEAGEIFQTYDAPKECLTKELLVPLNRLARKHPRLLQAMGVYLQRQHWQLDDHTYKALFTNQHVSDVGEETLSTILDTIEERESRQLLYRLNLIIGSFTVEEVLTLANVEPIIDQPRERFHALTGLWVERNSRERYAISSLVQTIGSHDVPSLARKACNRALAECLLAHQPINIWDIDMILIYLVNAEQYDRAGLLLIQALVDLRQQEKVSYDGNVLTNWAETPLPTQMNLGIRLYLRASQYTARHEKGLSTAYIEQNLLALLKQVTPNETWALLGILVVAPKLLPDSHAVLLKILRYLPQAHMPNGEQLALPEAMHLEELIWLTVIDINTIADLDAWMETVSTLTEKQRQYAFADDAAEDGARAVADVLWTREVSKPPPEQQWDTIQQAFEKLSAWAESLHLEVLWGCAMRARMIVAVEYRHDLPLAITLAEETLRQAPDDPRIRFLIEECLGRQYLFAKQYQEATQWLERACGEDTEAYPTVRIPALLAASRAYGMHDPAAAVPFAEQAVVVGKSTPTYPDMELVKVEGELALARWLTGNTAGTFEVWDAAGERLLACRREDDAWKGLFVLYGHVSGYFTAIASTGEPPTETPDGSTYILPERGIFVAPHDQLASRYIQARDCYLMTQLAIFAQAVGQEQRMLSWCEQGLRLAREYQQHFAWATLCELEIPFLIQKGDVQAVLDHAVDIATIVSAGMQQRTQVKDVLKSELVVNALLGPRPSATWNIVEERAAQLGMVPLVFWIATHALTNRSEATTMAHTFAERCRAISETASNRTLWMEGAALIERIFEGQASWREMNEQAKTFSIEEHKTLRLLGYLGATMQQRIPLAEAWFAHKAIIGSLDFNRTSAFTETSQRIILPFFSTYWINAFERQRFRFSSPQVVEKELQEIQKRPPRERTTALLTIIAHSLGISTTIVSQGS